MLVGKIIAILDSSLISCRKKWKNLVKSYLDKILKCMFIMKYGNMLEGQFFDTFDLEIFELLKGKLIDWEGMRWDILETDLEQIWPKVHR